jgi:allantoate deiminase
VRDSATTVMERCDLLANISEEPGLLVRPFGSQAIFSWQVRQNTPAVEMDPQLSELFGKAVQDSGVPVHQLPSGAGHDAAQMAELAPVAMLFVRCKEGISHNPAESVKKEDVETAIEVMSRFLRLVAEGSP